MSTGSALCSPFTISACSICRRREAANPCSHLELRDPLAVSLVLGGENLSKVLRDSREPAIGSGGAGRSTGVGSGPSRGLPRSHHLETCEPVMSETLRIRTNPGPVLAQRRAAASPLLSLRSLGLSLGLALLEQGEARAPLAIPR